VTGDPLSITLACVQAGVPLYLCPVLGGTPTRALFAQLALRQSA